MIACDRCRKRVEAIHNLRGTHCYFNEIQMFTRDYRLCGACHDSWDEMRKVLESDIEVYAKQEGARRLAEWMGSADVMHDPWSESATAEKVEEGGIL